MITYGFKLKKHLSIQRLHPQYNGMGVQLQAWLLVDTATYSHGIAMESSAIPDF